MYTILFLNYAVKSYCQIAQESMEWPYFPVVLSHFYIKRGRESQTSRSDHNDHFFCSRYPDNSILENMFMFSFEPTFHLNLFLWAQLTIKHHRCCRSPGLKHDKSHLLVERWYSSLTHICVYMRHHLSLLNNWSWLLFLTVMVHRQVLACSISDGLGKLILTLPYMHIYMMRFLYPRNSCLGF